MLIATATDNSLSLICFCICGRKYTTLLPPQSVSDGWRLIINVYGRTNHGPVCALRKQTYSNILKILPQKKQKQKTSDKNSDIFSSPEPKAQGKVLWSLTVRRRRRPSVRPSVRPFTIFKQHLLLNHWLDFDQISQEWSLVDPLSKLFKWFRSIAYLGHRS